MGRFGVARARSVGRRLRRGLHAARDAAEPPRTLTIDVEVYPVEPAPRYGYGQPPHPQIDALLRAGHERYRELLTQFCELSDDLGKISVVDHEPWHTQPFWKNSWFQGVDFVALYCLVAQRSPSTIIEVGSGISTRLIRKTIDDHGLSTRLISVDPTPRTHVVHLADEHVQEPLENIALDRFDRLTAGDIVFFDGSHRSFTNSDVTVMFNEVLPRLAPGVLVQVHDVFLPWDYPPYWADRWYSEQYLLTSWLLGGDRLEVVLPSMYVCINPDLHHVLDPIWQQFAWAGIETNGSSFWFEMRGPAR
jgi:predicted O-methyltransferase YrrM